MQSHKPFVVVIPKDITSSCEHLVSGSNVFSWSRGYVGMGQIVLGMDDEHKVQLETWR